MTDGRFADTLERRRSIAAGQQQDRIDADSPGHRLSSTEVNKHGAVGIFRMAARQAAARATSVRHDRQAPGE